MLTVAAVWILLILISLIFFLGLARAADRADEHAFRSHLDGHQHQDDYNLVSQDFLTLDRLPLAAREIDSPAETDLALHQPSESRGDAWPTEKPEISPSRDLSPVDSTSRDRPRT